MKNLIKPIIFVFGIFAVMEYYLTKMDRKTRRKMRRKVRCIENMTENMLNKVRCF